MERVTPQPPETGSNVEGHPPKVLVVDDDSRVVELLQITLGGRGYRVLTAHDGEEALEAVRTHRPDFLVLDVRLPRRNGIDVCETLRKDPQSRSLPIVLISGNAATDSRLQGLRAGADDYLIKPFSPRELLLKMQRILERNRDRDLLALKSEVLEEEIRRQRDHLREARNDFQSHLLRLGTILERIQDLNRHRSITEILNRFVVTAVGILDFESVALLLPREGMLVAQVHRGLRLQDPDSLRIDPEGEAGRVLHEASHAVSADDLALRPGCRNEVGLLSAAGLLWCAGVEVEGRLRAVLAVGERTDRKPLDRFDLRLVEALGHSVGTALANADAFERTQGAFLGTITSLLAAFESRYPWLVGHSERVQDLAVRVGEAAGLEEVSLQALATAALLHNLGAVERHEELLRATVVLSPAERMLRQREASEAAGKLLAARGREGIAEILRHQAEYWDGSGVPDGLKGDRIPIGARILSLANAYDALIHDRPHRRAYDVDAARELIRGRAGTQFDPDLVALLLRIPVASEIETS
ncbi:MAG: response regulator [Candidatus Eisenbacteria bacterium]|nr:response regulator [Candidatus Latescibacterota bacterium]MBD3303118.1 response regulator [Candidatus Eisenbacteria bacterium]